MSHDTSALNLVARQFERIKHITSDADLQWVIACQVFATHSSWISSFTHFGPKKHDLLYRTPRPISKNLSSSSDLEKDLARVSHLRPDLQDYVLLTLTSQQTHQSPASHFSRESHPLLQVRKVSPSSSNLVPGRTLKKVKKQPKMTDSQITSLALSSKLLHGKKTTPIFSQLFPETTWPQITFVQGHPRIDRELFNSLLLSRIRAIKSKVVESGAPAPSALSKNLILRISRMIDLSLSMEFDKRTTVQQQTKVSSVKKVKAKAKTQLAARFVSPTIPEPTTSTKAPAPIDEPQSPQGSDSPALDTSTPLPSSGTLPWIQFLDGNDFSYLGPSEAQRLLTVHRKLVALSTFDSFNPSRSYSRLTPAELDALSEFDVRHLLAFVSDSWLRTISSMQPLVAISKVDELRHKICSHFRSNDPSYQLESRFLADPLVYGILGITPPPLSDIVNDEVLDFYRRPLAAHSEFFDDAIVGLESAVLTLRDLF
jgi:hypothetical protein